MYQFARGQHDIKCDEIHLCGCYSPYINIYELCGRIIPYDLLLYMTRMVS